MAKQFKISNTLRISFSLFIICFCLTGCTIPFFRKAKPAKNTSAVEKHTENTEMNKTESKTTKENSEISEKQKQKLQEIKNTFTRGFSGVDESGASIYWAMSDDGTQSIFVIIEETGETIALAGTNILNSDGTYTLTDESSQMSLTYKAEDAKDDAGQTMSIITVDDVRAVVYPVDAENMLNLLYQSLGINLEENH